MFKQYWVTAVFFAVAFLDVVVVFPVFLAKKSTVLTIFLTVVDFFAIPDDTLGFPVLVFKVVAVLLLDGFAEDFIDWFASVSSFSSPNPKKISRLLIMPIMIVLNLTLTYIECHLQSWYY